MAPTALELRRVALPLRHPHRFAHGTETDREVVVVAYHRPDGVVGWGECSTLRRPTYTAEWTAGAWTVLTEILGPALLAGRDPGVIGHPMARAALEVAALDARLKVEGRSLSTHLGGRRTRVPTRSVIGMAETPAAVVEAVAGRLAAGVRSVKLKVAPGWDLDPLRALRERWPSLDCAADANGSYAGDPAAALALDRFGLTYLEQPLDPADLVGHAALRRRLATPIALDESLDGPGALRSAVALGALDVASIKPARVGGLERAATMVALVAESGFDGFVGGMLETGIGRATALAVASLPGCGGPTDLGPSSHYFARDLTTPMELDEDGFLAVPTGAGIGVEVDFETVEAHTRERLVLER